MLLVRIIFLGINYWPEETGIAVFNTARCEYLASRGHEVTICTSFPYYPEWRIAEGYRGKLLQRDAHNKVEILRSFAYVPASVTSVKRILHEASFVATSALRALARRKPDLIVTVSPPLALAATARMLSRLWRVPYVFHVEDMQPDAAADLGMLRQGGLMRSLYALERGAYRHAAMVSTLTEGMRRGILSKGVPPEKVVVFGHWAEQQLFDIPLSGGGNSFRQAKDLCQKLLVLHTGNMGVKQGMEVILDAAHRSRHCDDLVYLLVGDGAARPKLQAKAQSMRLDNIRFLPIQPRETFLDMLAAADVCLVTQRRSVADIVFPSKTVTLLAAGRPVVASVAAHSQIANVINDARAGIVTEPEDPEALFSAIFQLRDDLRRRTDAGASGRAYARRVWSATEILPIMERQLSELARSWEGARGGWRSTRSAEGADG
jgi:putative colanic acid biosynthesis glycosyltransferase WcaI